MSRKTKVIISGKEVNGEELNFKIKKEDWNEYELEDGTIIRLKVIVSRVIRSEIYNPITKEPIYSIVSSNVVDAIVPEEKKQK